MVILWKEHGCCLLRGLLKNSRRDDMQKANIIHQDTCKSEYGKTFDQTELSFNRSKVDPRAIQAAENDEVILYCKVNKTKIP